MSALDVTNHREIDSLLGWANSKVLQPLYIPKASAEHRTFDESEFASHIIKRLREGREIYMIRSSNMIVGSLSIAANPPEATWKKEPTGWLGLVVGKEKHRNQGIGSFALRFAETRAEQLRLSSLEVGVFEFNKNAIAFFMKNGFRVIGRVEEATCWENAFCAAIHLVKKLPFVDR